MDRPLNVFDIKLLFFHHNLMKLGEVVVCIEYYNFTKFHYILMKKIIVLSKLAMVLYQTHLTLGLSITVVDSVASGYR